MTRGPIVMNTDRDWALAQKPAWARMYDDAHDEIVDDGDWLDAEPTQKHRDPSWFDFVVGEVERFERYFAGQFKTESEWSTLWRKGWWPKRREDWKFKMAPKASHPFFREGSPEFARALTVATPEEKAMWTRFRVAQFKPDDPRLAQVQSPALTPASKRMTGDVT